MIEKRIIRGDRIPGNLLANLDNRDIVLWLRNIPQNVPRTTLTRFLGLPWRVIVSEVIEPSVFRELQKYASVDDPLTRKLGYVQIIDSDPSRIELPERSLLLSLPTTGSRS